MKHIIFGSSLKGHYVYQQLADARVAQLLDLADELLSKVAKGVSECQSYE